MFKSFKIAKIILAPSAERAKAGPGPMESLGSAKHTPGNADLEELNNR
jgi:hypothetical protein